MLKDKISVGVKPFGDTQSAKPHHGLPDGLHSPRIGRHNVLSTNRLCSMPWPDAGRAPLESGVTGKVTSTAPPADMVIERSDQPSAVGARQYWTCVAWHITGCHQQPNGKTRRAGNLPIPTFAWSRYSPDCRVRWWGVSQASPCRHYSTPAGVDARSGTRPA